MHGSKLVGGALLALLALSSCYTVSYQTQKPGSGTYREERGDFFLWGLVGEKTVDLKALCPDGPSRWRSQTTFVDALLGIVTLGIYIPRHVTVECASGTAWDVELDAADRVASITPAAHAG